MTNTVEAAGWRVGKDSAVSLVNDLRYLLLSTVGDVELVLERENGNTTVNKNIHSIILKARSRWFAENHEIFNNTGDLSGFKVSHDGINMWADKKNDKLVLHIQGISVQSVQDFVKYLYLAQRNIFDSNAIQLLGLAHIFKISSFKAQISSFLIRSLKDGDDLTYTIQLYEWANKCQLEDLEAKCKDVINREKGLVVQMKKWRELDSKLVARAFA